MPLFRYFIVVGTVLMTGLYVLSGHLAPQPLPPYFGQTAELPKNFYQSSSELSARQTARWSGPMDSMTPAPAAVADAPVAPDAASAPPPATKVARKTLHQQRANRQSPDRQMPERIRTVRGGDMMVPIRLE